MWRYSENPVIDRYHIPSSNSIFNSAVVPFGDGYAGVFRCDNRAVQMNIFAAVSYTHLSGMPRQVGIFHRTPAVQRGDRSSERRQVVQGDSPQQQPRQQVCAEPVSYTHLDVYKRQGQHGY